MSREKIPLHGEPQDQGQGASARLNGLCAQVSGTGGALRHLGQRSPFFLRMRRIVW